MMAAPILDSIGYRQITTLESNQPRRNLPDHKSSSDTINYFSGRILRTKYTTRTMQYLSISNIYIIDARTCCLVSETHISDTRRHRYLYR